VFGLAISRFVRFLARTGGAHARLMLPCVISLLGSAYAGPLAVRPTGPKEMVFRWETQRCHDEDFPDSPARAFRRSDGKVVLSAAHFGNYYLLGDDLNTVAPTCKRRYVAPMDRDPNAFNARVWFQSFFTENGKDVVAIGGSDYHGIWFKNCDDVSPRSQGCWWSALVLGKSNDGGMTFTMKPAPSHIVARPQIAFSSASKGPVGFFLTSNIVQRDDGFYYMLAYTFGYAGQKPGNCLLRVKDLSDARQWRAWDGLAFAVQFANDDRAMPSDHAKAACVPVDGLTSPVRSLLWHADSRQYLAILGRWEKVAEGSGDKVRIHFQTSTSTDLIHWSAPVSFLRFDSRGGCDRLLEDVAYPSVIDGTSKDRNFGTVGRSGYVYFTRFNRPNGCGATMNRDLVRIPLTISETLPQ
jgi:hypothetical protein